MAKSPIWPCYYNDLRGSTQDWTDEEFGAFVRLLIYQWDKGYIPAEERRRAKISDSANQHWALLSEKFEVLINGNLVNKKGEEIKLEKENFSLKQKENIKKRYQNSTKTLPKDYQSDYQNDSKNLPLEGEDEDKEEIEDKERGPGETIPPEFIKGAGVLIVPEMLSVWLAAKPDYISVPQNDFSPLREIAQMIAASKSIHDITKLDSTKTIKESFSKIIDFVITHKLYKDFQLSQIARYFNAITSTMKSEMDEKKATSKSKNKPNIINNNMSAANGARDILESKYGEVTK